MIAKIACRNLMSTLDSVCNVIGIRHPRRDGKLRDLEMMCESGAVVCDFLQECPCEICNNCDKLAPG